MKTRHLTTFTALLLLLATSLFFTACSSNDEEIVEEVPISTTDVDGTFSTDDFAEAPVSTTESVPLGFASGESEKSVAVTSARVSSVSDGGGVRGSRSSESVTVMGSGGAMAAPEAASLVAPGAPSTAKIAPGALYYTEGGEAEIASTGDRIDGPVKEMSARDMDGDIVEFEDREFDPAPAPDAGQLTAGEWSDLREWDYWESVIRANDWKGMAEYWTMGNGTRISVRVDNGKEPIADATVTLLDKSGKTLWLARSDNHGRAELFTGLEDEGSLPPYEIVVEAGGETTSLGGVDPSREQAMNETPLVARIPAKADDSRTVDVMFVIDATGSMGDELHYIKAELESVFERVNTAFEEEDLTIRLGANVYRDESDAYLIRTHPLSENVDDVAKFLRQQSAGGGGDMPEAVEVGLEDAIEKQEWSESARARLLFLVLDAPPHYTDERLEKLRNLTRRAAELGIRVIPVSSSGVDKETEFLMRFLGIHTGGTYTFLTDHSGIGESHIKPTIGSHEIEYLNDLIVRLIVQYTDRPASLDAITPRVPEIK